MREILFKAKRIDDGEWVEGFYCKRKHYCFDKRTDESKDVIMTYFSSTAFVCYEIDPNTICQYTGLTDKNGNKIWENDIVIGREVYCGNPKLPTREIEFKVEYSRGYYRWLDNADMYEFEVIGNIFDNPELLKGGAE